MSTGHLHWIGSNPSFIDVKNPNTPNGVLGFLLLVYTLDNGSIRAEMEGFE